jgi:hypothetical protein
LLIVNRGSIYCNNSGGACFFFDIDVKGGESVMVRMLRVVFRFFKVSINAKGGDFWNIYYGQKAEYLFVSDGKLNPMMTNKRKWQDQLHNDDHMERSEA